MAEGGCVRVGGTKIKYLKRGWNRKEGRGNKDFRNGGQLGSRVGCLKKGGLEPPYKLCVATTLWKYNQFPSLWYA